ncbi:hypothetical protein RND71_031990 [Anisodus tanguticus]|uniref:Uncharacterized protein n=1 Tax=Anisodus tanguticus TaxID=243964 RepID=A0AAE1RBR7_9SOLA|nr:hypothetical protein RND71_031990 [Anisodus tanguticus]
MAGRNGGRGANGCRGGNAVPPPPKFEYEGENVVTDLLQEVLYALDIVPPRAVDGTTRHETMRRNRSDTIQNLKNNGVDGTARHETTRRNMSDTIQNLKNNGGDLDDFHPITTRCGKLLQSEDEKVIELEHLEEEEEALLDVTNVVEKAHIKDLIVVEVGRVPETSEAEKVRKKKRQRQGDGGT